PWSTMQINDVKSCAFDYWYDLFKDVTEESARLHEPQSEDSDDDCRPEFPEFEAKVSDAIAQLGGCVFPKLNWSAPKSSRSRVDLIDFNVFGQPTDSLLFSWTELEQVSTTEEIPQPVFRVQEDPSIRPNAFRQYSVPVDLIDIASGSDPRKMMDFVQA
ncbi:hypothetical protein X801_05600, partial [Opisthorchis viverrini]